MSTENSLEVKNKISTIWDKCGNSYDNDYAHGLKSEKEKQEWLKLLDSMIPVKPSKILDVGAGTGFLSLLLSELGHQCKGIDLSEGMLSRAKLKAQESGFKELVFEIGDAENLSEPDNRYDVVINRHLVWTLPHPKKAIAEWARVLKPGGRLIIIDGDWFHDSFINRVKIILGTCMVSVKEGKNAFKNVGNYDDELISKLPMMHDENARQLVDMAKKSGLDIEVRDAKAVEKAEKEIMSLGYRLKNPYKRTIIIGTKI